MYKCYNCSRLMENFDSWTESHGEIVNGCGKCGGAVSDAIQCKICKRYFTDDEEVVNEICEQCIKDMWSVGLAKDWIKASNLEVDFYINFYYQSEVESASDELLQLCRDRFNWTLQQKFCKVDIQAEQWLMDYCYKENWYSYAEYVSRLLP